MNKAKALTAYLAGRQPAPFSWSTANCTHFAGAFVADVEGRNPLADVTMPATLAAARRMLTQEGGLHALVTAALARPSIAPTLAQLGDVVLLAVSEHDADAQALGLCCGEYAAAVTAEGGLTMHPMTNGLAAWRVGA